MRPSLIVLAFLGALGPQGPRQSAARPPAHPPVLALAPTPRFGLPAARPDGAMPAGYAGMLAPTPPARLAPPAASGERPHSFYFTRAAYNGSGYGWRGSRWRTDSPKADLQLLTVLQRLLPTLDIYPDFHPLALTDPELRRYPFLYAVEVSSLYLDGDDLAALRSYLQAGGFLMVDDFWGTREWMMFESQITKLFPERPIEEIPLSDPIFHTYYDIDKIEQVPNGPRICNGYPTYEQDGYTPHIRGIRDDEGRIMVLIDWNSDMGDAWEWAEQACYPLEYSTYAFQVMANAIVYAMSR